MFAGEKYLLLKPAVIQAPEGRPVKPNAKNNRL
jgi:hypothetical protein